ncbi:tetracycline resistance protein, class C-like isoform X3 [Cloeon dipterum]|uniref:tetracycline resistance protein, class C-like isoform X3 n=1 Tax=Cloeon dipterum TaxID=197152 RepID=UPI0032204088
MRVLRFLSLHILVGDDGFFSIPISWVISQSWLLRLACEELTASECNATHPESCTVNCNLQETQVELQRKVAEVQAWRSAIEFSLPLVLVPFLGAWSDAEKNRRLPVILYALVGRIAQLLLVILLLLLPSAPSLLVAGLCLAVPVAVTASSMTVDMAAYSYISDTTAKKIRTVRLGLANACWCLGSVLGLLMSGLLLRLGGELLAFTTALGLQILACLVSVWRMKKLSEENEMSSEVEEEGDMQEKKQTTHCGLILEPISVAVAKRPGKGRILILLMLFNMFLAFGASCGRQAIMFLYTRLRFQWDEVEYGFYGTFLMLMEVIGSVIAMSIFSHKLKLSDAVVGLMSCVSQVLSSTFYTFAKSTLGMYIAPLVEIANGQVVVIPRAMVTKLTGSNEQGKVHALFGCVEAVVPLVFEPLYNSVYAATLDTVPQLVFWLSAIFTLPPTFLFIWLQWGSGKNWIAKGEQRSSTDNEEQKS